VKAFEPSELDPERDAQGAHTMSQVPSGPGAADELTPEAIDRLRESAQAGLGALGSQTPMEETIGRAQAELELLEQGAAAGQIAIGDYEARRSALLRDLQQSVMDLKLSAYASALTQVTGPGIFDLILAMFLPGSAPGASAGRTYSLAWTDSPAPGILQTQGASTATGKLFAVAQTDRNVLKASGFAQAALGILVKPRHTLTRIRFTPEMTYTYSHVIDTPKVPGDVDWSRATNQGRIRLVAQRLNPVTNQFEDYLQRSLALWSDSSTIGSARYQDQGTASYPGSDPGLLVIGSSADTFALWIIATIHVTKVDHDPNPANRTLCFGALGYDIPVMWAEQDKLS
jgi:hypothetical protein